MKRNSETAYLVLAIIYVAAIVSFPLWLHRVPSPGGKIILSGVMFVGALLFWKNGLTGKGAFSDGRAWWLDRILYVVGGFLFFGIAIGIWFVR